MKIFYPLVLFIFIFSSLTAQVTITSADMPVPGDTIRKSITYSLDGIDYETTGEGVTWDFSGLTVMLQQVDTFVTVGSTPFLYQLVFNNPFIYPDHVATVAQKLPAFNQIPGFEVSGAFQFQQVNEEDHREVGYGVSMAGFEIPVPYEEIDIVYRFPMTMGDEDSSASSFAASIPDMGSYTMERERHNIADGWGTLITPYGQFEALRVKTIIHQFDSVYVDSLGGGFPVNRIITQYKWLANGFHIPLLEVDLDGLLLSATYIDSARTAFLGVDEPLSFDFNFNIFPNPCREYFSLAYELYDRSDIRISVFSTGGHCYGDLITARQERGLYNMIIYPAEYKLSPGIYLLRFEVNGTPVIKRLVVR